MNLNPPTRVYHFFHPLFGVLIGTKRQLSDRFMLSPVQTYNLVTLRSKASNGWSIDWDATHVIDKTPIDPSLLPWYT